MKHILEAVVWNVFRSKRPKGFYHWIKGHTGVDLNYVFEALPSPISGKVDLIAKQPEMGNVLYIKDIETGAIHVFAHLLKIDVMEGQHIRIGDKLGTTGNTGDKSTDAHLHYEIIYFLKPDPKNPLPYDKLFQAVMTRSLQGYKGYNVDPIGYLKALYGKYNRNLAGETVN